MRRQGESWEVAVIHPNGKSSVCALPKGHIDPGEKPEGAAEREVREETGLEGTLIQKLGDVKYTYRFQGESTFKVVSFFLFEYKSGDIDVLTPQMRIEVELAFWLPIERAGRELSYPGERQMVQKALSTLSTRTQT